MNECPECGTQLNHSPGFIEEFIGACRDPVCPIVLVDTRKVGEALNG